MILSNGIHLPDLNGFGWVVDRGYYCTLQSRDIMKTGSTASGIAALVRESPVPTTLIPTFQD